MNGRPEELRVLRVLTRPNLGGPARQCRALSRVWPELGVRELVVVGSVRDGETELALPQPLSREEAEVRGTDACGSVRLPELWRRVDPAADIASLSALLRLGRTFRPHVVHTHTAKAGLLGTIAARWLGVPLAHSFHGHVLRGYFSGIRQRAVRSLERRLTRRRDAVFCVSESCGRELEELDVVRAGAWQVVPPALELPPFPGDPHEHRLRVRRELRIDPERLVLGFCGRLVPVKDPVLFVHALERAARIAPRPVLGVVFGSGPLSEILVQAAKRLPLRVLGPRADYPALLPALDVLLVTSQREGLPLAALEALASGVPVVGPRVPGLVDLGGPGVRLVHRSSLPLARAALAPPAVPAASREEVRLAHDPRRVARQLAERYRQLQGAVTG